MAMLRHYTDTARFNYVFEYGYVILYKIIVDEEIMIIYITQIIIDNNILIKRK